MLLKPVVPFSPVTIKDTVVVVTDWFVARVTLEICALVMFPLIARSTVTPLVVVALTGVDEGVAGSDGFVGVGNVVDGGVGVGVAVGVAVGVGVGFGVSVGVGDGVAVIEGVGVGIGVDVDVGVGV
jgi:hypothetical protein